MNSSNYSLSFLLILGLTLSLAATASLVSPSRTQSAFAQPSSNTTNSNSTFLSYDSKPPYSHRSAAAEWEPHTKQTSYSQEWWYITAFLNDAKGNLYSLLFVDSKFDGEKTSVLLFNPQLVSMLKPNQVTTQCVLGFSAYDSNHRMYTSNAINDNKSDIWDAKNNAIKYNCKGITGYWSYDGTDMKFVVRSQNLTADLDMKDTHPVMWTKDSAYNTQGVLQQGGPGNLSFYYSLPRQDVKGNLSYIDKEGHNKTVEATGLGWTDRQWGDFNPGAWEWSSFRFDNGARVNLYSFGNSLAGGEAYLVGTYQNADGSLQYFNNFTVKQDGYAKNPDNNVWVAFGWSYDFPIDIEGSKHYSVVPFSNQFTNMPPVEWISTGTGWLFIEQGGKLINDDTGDTVGSVFTESMPIQELKNGPYEVNQH
jgi:predicted secreted hydrolase